MKLQSGMKAPEIRFRDYNSVPFSLESLQGRKVLLSFYRYAGCPFCQLRFMEIAERFGTDERLELVAVFQSPEDSIRKHAGGVDVPTTVIGDPGERFYKEYGVEEGLRAWFVGITSAFRFTQSLGRGHVWGKKEGSKNRIPADFLIDKDGILRHAYYGKNMDDHMPIDWIDDFLKL